MSWDPEICGYGPFNPTLGDDLDYRVEYYEDTPQGAEISVSRYLCGGKTLGQELQHWLGNPAAEGGQIFLDKISHGLGGPEHEEIFDLICWTKRMLSAGFKMFFRANY